MKVCELFTEEISNSAYAYFSQKNDKIMTIIEKSNISQCLS